MKIKINEHSSICLNDCIYFDPFKLKTENPKAKYIFITHPHWDHFSPEDIEKIVTKETKFVCPKSMQKEISQFKNDVLLVEPNKTYQIDDLTFSTFPSYNIDKPFHPKENNWVGYNLLLEGKNVTIVGDSDATDELKSQKSDILILPIGGTYTMDIQQALNLTRHLKPQKVIPTHYGQVTGHYQMGREFKEIIGNEFDCYIFY